MGIMDYFKPVDTWAPDKVRQFLNEMSPQDYNLVDVRTPKEYEQGHLPGAQLIPVGELESQHSRYLCRWRCSRFQHQASRECGR